MPLVLEGTVAQFAELAEEDCAGERVAGFAPIRSRLQSRRPVASTVPTRSAMRSWSCSNEPVNAGITSRAIATSSIAS